MAKRKFTSEEVLQAVLDSNSDVELDYNSDLDSNKSDDDTRAIQDAGNDYDDDIDDGSHARQDANQDNESDTDGWSCPNFVWTPACKQLPILYPFARVTGVSVDVNNFTAGQFYALFLSSDVIRHFVTQTNLFAEESIRHVCALTYE